MVQVDEADEDVAESKSIQWGHGGRTFALHLMMMQAGLGAALSGTDGEKKLREL